MCGMVLCDVVYCGVVCDVWHGVMCDLRSDVVWCDVWFGAEWCSVIWCGVMLCGVMWCVPKSLLSLRII